MFASMLVETTKDERAFVDDACVDPSRRETAKVSSFTSLIDGVLFELLFLDKGLPAWIDFFENIDDGLEAITFGGAVEFEDTVNAELDAE